MQWFAEDLLPFMIAALTGGVFVQACGEWEETAAMPFFPAAK